MDGLLAEARGGLVEINEEDKLGKALMRVQELSIVLAEMNAADPTIRAQRNSIVLELVALKDMLAKEISKNPVESAKRMLKP